MQGQGQGLLVVIECDCVIAPYLFSAKTNVDSELSASKMSYLRWDWANLVAFYELTRVSLSEIMSELNEVEKYDLTVDTVDLFYDIVINILQSSYDMTVPRYHKNFFKYLWDQELDELKERSIASCKCNVM